MGSSPGRSPKYEAGTTDVAQAKVVGPLQIFECMRDSLPHTIVVPEHCTISGHELHGGCGIRACVIITMRAIHEDQPRLAVMVRPIECCRVAEERCYPSGRVRQPTGTLPEPHTWTRLLDILSFTNFQLKPRRLMRQKIEREDRAICGRIEG